MKIIPEDLVYNNATLSFKKGKISLDELGSFSLEGFVESADNINIEQGVLFLTNTFLSNWQNKMFGSATNLNLKIKELDVRVKGNSQKLKNVHFESIFGRGVVGHFDGFDFYQWGENSWIKGGEKSNLFLKIKRNRFCQININEKKGYSFYQDSGVLHLKVSNIKTLLYESKVPLELIYYRSNNEGSGLITEKNNTIILYNIEKELKLGIILKTESLEAIGEILESKESWTIQMKEPISWKVFLSTIKTEFSILTNQFNFTEKTPLVTFFTEKTPLVSLAQLTWKKNEGLNCLDLITGHSFKIKVSEVLKEKKK